MKRATGRPSDYTEEIAGEICRRIASGESLLSISKEEGMPGHTTIYQWMAAHSSFANKYAAARNTGLDVMADKLLDLSDEEVGITASGATDSGAVARQKLRVDTRKWYLSKMAPKRYGERATVEHSGPGGGPVQVVWNIVGVEPAQKKEEDA